MQLTNARQVCLHPELANSIATSNVVVAHNLTVGPLLLNGKLYMFEQLVRSILQLTAMALEQLPALILLENSGMKMTRRLGRGVLEPLDPKSSRESFISIFPFLSSNFLISLLFSSWIILRLGKAVDSSRRIGLKKKDILKRRERSVICSNLRHLRLRLIDGYGILKNY